MKQAGSETAEDVGERGLNANDGVTSPFGFPRVCAISSVSFSLCKNCITSLQHGHIYHHHLLVTQLNIVLGRLRRRVAKLRMAS